MGSIVAIAEFVRDRTLNGHLSGGATRDRVNQFVSGRQKVGVFLQQCRLHEYFSL